MTFFNIFSKKPINPVIKRLILIDNREKNSLVPSELSKLNFNIQFEHLKLGDYIVNNTIIERKSFSDLQASIINKRIFDQLNDLPKENSLLIIEGSGEKFIHENALRGFLLSLSLNYKIPFIFSEDEKETALYLSLLAKKQVNKEFSLRHSRSQMTREEIKQFILEGFPNIGPRTAKKLLEEFHTLSNIFNAPLSELEKIIKGKAVAFKSLLE